MLPSRFNTIRFKLSLIVGISTVLYFTILVTYFNIKYTSSLMESAVDESEELAKKYAGEIKSDIEQALNISRITSQILSNIKNPVHPLHLTRQETNDIIHNLVAKNPDLLGMYTAWEPFQFDGKDSSYARLADNHPQGYFVPYWYRDSKGNIAYEPLKDYLLEGKGDYYLKPRETKRETVIDPISYNIGDREVLLMTLVVPILNPEGKFVGITGTDISTESIQKMVDKANLFQGNGELSIISNQGMMVAVSGKKNFIGKNVREIYPDIAKFLETGVTQKSIIQSDTLKTIIPIVFGDTKTPWYVVIKLPVSYLTTGLTSELIKLMIFSFLFLGVLIFLISWRIVKLLAPIKKITRIAQKLAVGNLEVWGVNSTSVEIDQLNKAFVKVIDSQKQITEVTAAIASGDYSKYAEVKSDQDTLSRTVNQMIDFLKRSNEEDSRRKWTNEGYASFAEMLRGENELKKLCDASLRFLIRYLNINQGGLFVVTEVEGNTYLTLEACYAFDRTKFLNKRIEPGEGLIGQVYLEKDTVLLTEVPADYINITSGLGEANPNCVIIVPLINNEKIEGVLEMASFRQLGQYEIEFIEKCAVSLASVISNVRISQLTAKLLQQARERAEQMSMQEEEMRQNMEELSSTQEEMMRREEEYQNRIKVLENELNN